MKRFVLSLQVLLLSSLIAISGCNRKETPPSQSLLEKVTICTGGNIQVLPLIAENRGFFAESGIEGVVVNLGDGKKAIDAVLSGECNFGLLADPPVVNAATRRNDFAIIASTSSSDASVRITARRDRGIRTPADLRGKRIGVKKGLNSEAFAEALLSRYRIPLRDVTIVPLDLKDMPDSLVRGEIDAFSSSPTMMIEAKRKLGDNAVVLTEPGIYFNSNHLLARRDYLAANGGVVRRLLEALLLAEEFCRKNPREAEKILADRLRISEGEAAELLSTEKINLTLSPDQIRSLEQNAGLLRKRGTISAPFPNPLTIMDPSHLRALKPSAVTIGQ